MVGYCIKIQADNPSEVAKDAFRIYARFCHFLTPADLDELTADSAVANAPAAETAPEPVPAVEPEKPAEPEKTDKKPPETVEKTEETPEIDMKTLKKALIAVREKSGSEKIDELYAKYAHNASSVSKVAKEDYPALYAACQEVLHAAD